MSEEKSSKSALFMALSCGRLATVWLRLLAAAATSVPFVNE